MYPALRQALRAAPPDFVVLDRYALAGFDVCHDLVLEYAVNNANLLLDIDEPPAYIPPPYSGYILATER
jgi:ceramide galactosyltransferase